MAVGQSCQLVVAGDDDGGRQVARRYAIHGRDDRRAAARVTSVASTNARKIAMSTAMVMANRRIWPSVGSSSPRDAWTATMRPEPEEGEERRRDERNGAAAERVRPEFVPAGWGVDRLEGFRSKPPVDACPPCPRSRLSGPSSRAGARPSSASGSLRRHRPPRSTGPSQPIADAADGEDVERPVRIDLDLLAQPAHRDPHVGRVGVLGLGPATGKQRSRS